MYAKNLLMMLGEAPLSHVQSGGGIGDFIKARHVERAVVPGVWRTCRPHKRLMCHVTGC
jgi:hypothetical protein